MLVCYTPKYTPAKARHPGHPHGVSIVSEPPIWESDLVVICMRYQMEGERRKVITEKYSNITREVLHRALYPNAHTNGFEKKNPPCDISCSQQQGRTPTRLGLHLYSHTWYLLVRTNQILQQPRDVVMRRIRVIQRTMKDIPYHEVVL